MPSASAKTSSVPKGGARRRGGGGARFGRGDARSTNVGRRVRPEATRTRDAERGRRLAWHAAEGQSAADGRHPDATLDSGGRATRRRLRSDGRTWRRGGSDGRPLPAGASLAVVRETARAEAAARRRCSCTARSDSGRRARPRVAHRRSARRRRTRARALAASGALPRDEARTRWRLVASAGATRARSRARRSRAGERASSGASATASRPGAPRGADRHPLRGDSAGRRGRRSRASP